MAGKTSDRPLAFEHTNSCTASDVMGVDGRAWGEVLAGPIPGRVLRNEADCCQVPGTCRAQVTPHAGDLLDALTHLNSSVLHTISDYGRGADRQTSIV